MQEQGSAVVDSGHPPSVARRFICIHAVPIALIAQLVMALALGFCVSLGASLSPAIVLLGVLFALGSVVVLLLNSRCLPLYLLVAALPLEDVLHSPGLPSPVIAAFGILAVARFALREVMARPWKSIRMHQPSTAIVAFIAVWATLSSLWHSGPMGVASGARPYWLLFVLFVLTQGVLREEQDFVKLGWVLVVSLALTATVIVLQQLLLYLEAGGTVTARQLHLYAGDDLLLSTDPGIWGMRITKGIPFAFLLLRGRHGRKRSGRYLLGAAILVMLLQPIATLSINACVGLLTTLGMLGLLAVRSHVRARILLTTIVVLVVALVSPLGERVTEQLGVLSEGDPMSWGSNRGLAWVIGMEAIRQSPLWGIGPGREAIEAFSRPYLPYRMLKWGAEKLYPHNVFITVGAQLGIPGLLALVALLLSLGFRLLSRIAAARAQGRVDTAHDIRQAIFVGLVAFAVQGMGISVSTDNYVWLLLGLAAASNSLRPRATGAAGVLDAG